MTRGGPRAGAGRKRTVERRVNAPISVAALEIIDQFCRENEMKRADFLRVRLAFLVVAFRETPPPPLVGLTPGAPTRPVHLEMPAKLYYAAAEVVAAGKAPSLAALVRTAAEMTMENVGRTEDETR